MPSRIIVLDDDESMRLFCFKALETEGHQVSCTGNPVEALAMLDHEPVDLLIVDVLLAPPGLQVRTKMIAPASIGVSRLISSIILDGMAIVHRISHWGGHLAHDLPMEIGKGAVLFQKRCA